MTHQEKCEVRHCLALRNKDRYAVDTYLQLVTNKRGKEAADRLRNETVNQWNLGNRGRWGDWRK